MRTNIVIDDKLMAAAPKASGTSTKREAVELGLKTLLQLKQQGEIKRLRGKVERSVDIVIATRCIADRIELLHSDRDFAAFETPLGLRCNVPKSYGGSIAGIVFLRVDD